MEEPDGQKVALGHVLHVRSELAPNLSDEVPAGQSRQTDDLVRLLNCPVGQGRQNIISELKLPGRQGAHGDAETNPETAPEPAGQANANLRKTTPALPG